MGGSDDPSNLIDLTIEEHAEAHRVLYEQHGNWQDYCASQALSGRIGQEEILRMKQGAANRGRKRTPEQCERIKLKISSLNLFFILSISLTKIISVPTTLPLDLRLK